MRRMLWLLVTLPACGCAGFLDGLEKIARGVEEFTPVVVREAPAVVDQVVQTREALPEGMPEWQKVGLTILAAIAGTIGAYLKVKGARDRRFAREAALHAADPEKPPPVLP